MDVLFLVRPTLTRIQTTDNGLGSMCGEGLSTLMKTVAFVHFIDICFFEVH